MGNTKSIVPVFQPLDKESRGHQGILVHLVIHWELAHSLGAAWTASPMTAWSLTLPMTNSLFFSPHRLLLATDRVNRTVMCSFDFFPPWPLSFWNVRVLSGRVLKQRPRSAVFQISAKKSAMTVCTCVGLSVRCRQKLLVESFGFNLLHGF